MENKETLTKLFASIPIYNEEHIDVILTTMSKEDAIFILTRASIYAYDKGIFNLGESEVLSKAIRTLVEKDGNTEV